MAVFNFKSNRHAVDAKVDAAIKNALELLGQAAEGDVATNIKHNDTGALRQSITHKVAEEEDSVYIGSPMEYAPYVEYGTGIFAEKGGRQSGWWVYVKGNSSGIHGHKSYTYEEAKRIVARMQAQGIDAHMSQGMRPTHFMRDALVKNKGKYEKLASMALSSGVK